MLIAFCPAGKMEPYFATLKMARHPPGTHLFMRDMRQKHVGPSSFWKS